MLGRGGMPGAPAAASRFLCGGVGGAAFAVRCQIGIWQVQGEPVSAQVAT